MTISIQKLNPGDEARLRAVRVAALKEAPFAFDSTFQETMTLPIESWQQQLLTLPTFIAIVDGVDSGIVRGAPHSDDASLAYLISLWVAPQARGLGLGEALIDAVVTWARSAGYARLVLDVGTENQPAIALYTRKGFKPTGRTSHLSPPREHVLEQEMALGL